MQIRAQPDQYMWIMRSDLLFSVLLDAVIRPSLKGMRLSLSKYSAKSTKVLSTAGHKRKLAKISWQTLGERLTAVSFLLFSVLIWMYPSLALKTMLCCATAISARDQLSHFSISATVSQLINEQIKKKHCQLFWLLFNHFSCFSSHKCPTFAGSTSLNMRIYCFSLSFMIINEESLSFGQLVEQKKTLTFYRRLSI